MKIFSVPGIIFAGLLLTSCNKTKNCDCAPPPESNSEWKIVRYSGGIMGQTVEIPSAQQNTLKFSLNKFVYRNTTSGETTTGVYRVEPNTTTDPGSTRITFTPRVPSFYSNQMIILQNQSDTLVFIDGMADGYAFLLTRVK